MFQVVCVKWGTKYGAGPVNLLRNAIRRNTTSDFRFVCITDDAAGLDPAIVVQPFPDFVVPVDDWLKAECRLKLAMFAPGILQDGLPTIYVDLDTMIRGDLQRLTDLLVQKPGLYILPNHYIQWWPIQKYVRKIAPHKYYFGNSSLLAFWPERTHFIFQEFNRLVAAGIDPIRNHPFSDERFISWVAWEQIRVFPSSLAQKFAEEYMTPIAGIEEVRKHLPWVIARRRSAVAVTFVGGDFKPDKLIALKKGEMVRYRHLVHRWDHDDFAEYWKEARLPR